MPSDPPTSEEIVEGYWTLWRHTQTDDPWKQKEAQDAWWWAWEAVEDAVDRRDPDLVALFEALADAVAGDEAALAYLGAGPLETLLRHRGRGFADAFLEPLDAACVRNPNLQLAARCIWWSDEDDPDTVRRFQRFGPPL